MRRTGDLDSDAVILVTTYKFSEYTNKCVGSFDNDKIQEKRLPMSWFPTDGWI